MKIPKWVERYLDKPPEQRRKISLGDEGLQRSPSSKYRQRCDWDHEQILQYLRSNYILSARKLQKKALENDVSPSMPLIRKRFGSWANCKKEAFGDITHPFKAVDEKDFILSLVRFKVTTYRQFLDLKRKNPNLVPGYNYVLEKFGSWANVSRVVSGCMIESILERYIALKIELKHLPTPKDCKERGVELEVLLDFMSRDDLILLISKMEPYYAAKVGDSGQTLASVQ